jgi:hypothetical protein
MVLNKDLKATLNISGALLEALEKNNHEDILRMVVKLHDNGQLELTSTAKFHAFLPLMSKVDVIRQIQLNNDCLRNYFGSDLQIEGFFPPEMGFSSGLVPILQELNFKWVILDEISATRGDFIEFPGDHIPVIKDTSIKVILRNRRFSNLIMSALVRNQYELSRILDTEDSHRKYIVTGMDGETFGHHRPGLVPVLESILSNTQHPVVLVRELLANNLGLPFKEFVPQPSTWASSPQDIERNVQFLSWKDPDNEIHSLQWELVNLITGFVNSLPSNSSARLDLDVALASDHFWWASAKPWWGLEMVEDGAYRLYAIALNYAKPDDSVLTLAKDLYFKIISKAFEWQRTGIIRKRRESEFNARIPFIDRTLERGGEHIGIYEAFMDIMRENELKSAKNADYEQAIMWRDAQEKIKTKNDIYDAVHAVDVIRAKMPFDIVEKILDKYTDKYKKIRGGQPEQRD